jgi:hypothetical protein
MLPCCDPQLLAEGVPCSAPFMQRDPGEALLELQQLGAVQPEALRKARIDLHLRR